MVEDVALVRRKWPFVAEHDQVGLPFLGDADDQLGAVSGRSSSFFAPEEIARANAYLASDDAEYRHVAAWVIGGGLVAA